MPAFQVTRIPFQEDTLQVLARDLWAGLAGAAEGDLSAGLVLLPSARACRSLSHAILAASDRDTLLLPRLQTVAQWAREQEVALGLPAQPFPDDRLRPLILAPHLANLPWLAENPESATGLAHELIEFFDEVRLHDQSELLLDPTQLGAVQILAGSAEADFLTQDLARVQEAWAIYRQFVPVDTTDRLVGLAQALLPDSLRQARSPELVFVAGFGRVDPIRAGLLKAALASGQSGRVYLPTATGPLAQLFVTTWGAEPSPTDPLAPARQIEELLVGQSLNPAPAAPTLRERLAHLRATTDPAELLAPKGSLELIPCGDAEAECRLVASRVAEILAAAAAAREPTPRITIALNDPNLAARLRAHLKDAGLDCDHTHGDPLSALPAGLLVRFILRAALTDLRIEPLLEVLTHPYMRLPTNDEDRSKWTLRLEQMYRRNQGPRGGLAALHRRASERDEAVLNLFGREQASGGAGMVDFVTHLADTFAPLLPFADGRPRPWRELLQALRACWALLAPTYELNAADPDRADIGKLHALLDQLDQDSDFLPPANLADFSSDLGRLLAAENVAAHRKPHLPVVVAGLVEARLERSDVLILAGLRDGVFPKKSARPLFLAGGLRERLGLPGWPAALARDAELFTRLLHGAPRVVLTWSTEGDGAPSLPSSFVSRLDLVLRPDLSTPASARSRRVHPVPWAEIDAAEQTFATADRAVRVAVPIRPLTTLSWSALRTWRDCPYRFVLERGFALRREEEVQEEFRRLDYGNLVHAALQDWLDPAGAGYAALVAGDVEQARTALDRAARSHFERGFEEMPQRRLWFEVFRGTMPALVAVELARFAAWRPLALEQGFVLPLAGLREWTVALAAERKIELVLPELSGAATEIALRGAVDRVDLSQDGTGAVAVIDYKTGVVPSLKKVAELEELQILLYAAAVEMGALDPAGGPRRVREGLYYAVNSDKVGGPVKPHLDGDDDEGRRLLVDGAVRLIELAVAAADSAGTYPLLPREMAGNAPTRLPCETCDFRGVCRLEELSVPASTERKLDKLVNRKDSV